MINNYHLIGNAYHDYFNDRCNLFCTAGLIFEK